MCAAEERCGPERRSEERHHARAHAETAGQTRARSEDSGVPGQGCVQQKEIKRYIYIDIEIYIERERLID